VRGDTIMNPNISRYCRTVSAALFAAALTLLPACGSKDQRPLVLVDAPLGTYAASGATVKITVTLDSGSTAQKVVTVAQDSSGKLGIYLPSGSSGTATVTVEVISASGCVIASGTATGIAVKAGERSASATIILSAAGSCGLDGGALDGSAPKPLDGGAVDGPGGETAVVVDTRPPALDGAQVSVDVEAAGQDGPFADLAPALDAKADVAIPTPDVPEDVPHADLPAGPDLGPVGPVDAPPSTMNVLANCTSYTHSQKTSAGAIQDWGIRQLAFSPDGKILVSFGEDGRAKVWNVTATGLVAPSSGLVFSGGNSVYGTISQDGKYVAVGDSYSEVKVYNLGTSIQLGAPSTQWTLPPDSLAPQPDRAERLQFTTDGGHLVVVYSASSRPDPNQFVVWDLGTQQVVRLVKYGDGDWPMAIFPGDYTGAMWVASATSITADAGDYVSTVTLMDVSQASPSKAQVTMPGYINKMAFSPDGTTLAIGFDSGEVSQWDITTKSNIVRLGSPLIVGSTSSANSTYSLAYTPDGKYLAAGTGDLFGASSVSLVLLQQKQALQKAIDYLPWSLAFAPDGLGLAVGERDFGVLLYCRP
jgi:hypothetical protein